MRKLRQSPFLVDQMLADRTQTFDDDDDYKKTHELVESEVIRAGRAAYATTNLEIKGYLSHLEEKYDTKWYRSTDTLLAESPFIGFISRKKWPLNDELNLHLLRYQQVTLQINQVSNAV